jgi:hypothetical protein
VALPSVLVRVTVREPSGLPTDDVVSAVALSRDTAEAPRLPAGFHLVIKARAPVMRELSPGRYAWAWVRPLVMTTMQVSNKTEKRKLQCLRQWAGTRSRSSPQITASLFDNPASLSVAGLTSRFSVAG